MIALAFVGAAVSIFAGFWLLIESFKVSVLWGLLFIFVPFASLVFVVLHWHRAKRPFLIGVAASAIMAIGLYPMIREQLRLQADNIVVAAPDDQ